MKTKLDPRRRKVGRRDHAKIKKINRPQKKFLRYHKHKENSVERFR